MTSLSLSPDQILEDGHDAEWRALATRAVEAAVQHEDHVVGVGQADERDPISDLADRAIDPLERCWGISRIETRKEEPRLR